MNGEARKLNLLGALLAEQDEKVWDEIENILLVKRTKPVDSVSLKVFAVILTHEEALEMKRVIAESCEQIDPNDWK